MKMPLVSVVVPIYNAEKYLTECIESIINQNYENIEIVLVNDGSQDGSLAICEKYYKKDGRIRIIDQVNKGVTYSRKKGTIEAKGDYILYIDGDDWIDRDMINSMVSIAIKYDTDLVSTELRYKYQDGRADKIGIDFFDEGLYIKDQLDTNIFPYMIWNRIENKQGMICCMVNKLFKRNIMLEVQERMDEKICYLEDSMCYVYALSCQSIYILKKSFYNYRQHIDSCVRTTSDRLINNSVLLFNYLEMEFLKYKNPYLLINQLNEFFIDYNEHLMKMVFKIDLKAYSKWNFSFNEDIWNKKIIIYGAGLIGRAFYNECVKRGCTKHIVAWIDREPRDKSRLCLYNISPIEEIYNFEYEKIVIAIQDRKLADLIRENLICTFNICDSDIVIGDYKYLGN